MSSQFLEELKTLVLKCIQTDYPDLIFLKYINAHVTDISNCDLDVRTDIQNQITCIGNKGILQAAFATDLHSQLVQAVKQSPDNTLRDAMTSYVEVQFNWGAHFNGGTHNTNTSTEPQQLGIVDSIQIPGNDTKLIYQVNLTIPGLFNINTDIDLKNVKSVIDDYIIGKYTNEMKPGSVIVEGTTRTHSVDYKILRISSM